MRRRSASRSAVTARDAMLRMMARAKALDPKEQHSRVRAGRPLRAGLKGQTPRGRACETPCNAVSQQCTALARLVEIFNAAPLPSQPDRYMAPPGLCYRPGTSTVATALEFSMLKKNAPCCREQRSRGPFGPQGPPGCYHRPMRITDHKPYCPSQHRRLGRRRRPVDRDWIGSSPDRFETGSRPA